MKTKSNSPTSGLSPLAAVPAYSAEFFRKKSAYSSKAMAKTHRKHCFQCIFGAYNLEIGFLRGFFKKSQFVTRKQAGGRRRPELPAQSRPPGATHTELPAQNHPPGAACNAGQSFIYTIFVVQSSTFQTSVTKSS